MRKLHVWGLTAVLAVLVLPDASSAQIADRVRRERMERERLERQWVDRYDPYDRYDRRRSGKAKGGPAFCRSGRGHPVKGRRWCVDKGFGLGGYGWGWDDPRYGYGWERVRWPVVLNDRRYDRDRYDRRYDDRYDDRYERRDRDRYEHGRRDGGWLRDVVGDIVFGRLTSHSRSLGWNEPLVGEWFDDDRARVLTVFAGERPLAELVDHDRDGRADDVRLVRVSR